jgi:hypothetical protein
MVSPKKKGAEAPKPQQLRKEKSFSQFYIGNRNVNRPFSLPLKLLDRPLMGSKPLLLSLFFCKFVALVDLPVALEA